MRRVLGPLLVLLSVVAPLGGGVGLSAERAGDPGEHDFGDSIVVFTLEYEDDLLPAPPWALARASVRRLGTIFFLTGTLPEGRGVDGTDAPPTRRFWIPLADVVRIAEYEDLESAREALGVGADDDVMERQVGPGGRNAGNLPALSDAAAGHSADWVGGVGRR